MTSDIVPGMAKNKTAETEEVLSGPTDPKPILVLPDVIGEVTLPDLGNSLIPGVVIVDGRRVFVNNDSELKTLLPEPAPESKK